MTVKDFKIFDMEVQSTKEKQEIKGKIIRNINECFSKDKFFVFTAKNDGDGLLNLIYSQGMTEAEILLNFANSFAKAHSLITKDEVKDGK